MRTYKYQCPKCGSRDYELGEIRAVGGFWTKLFDIQTQRFTTVTCKRCRFTELFRTPSKKFGNVIDFFIH
jgi:predicted nucleic-acid-binding Zn-ribbon protein